MNDADIRRLVEQIRGSAPVSTGGGRGSSRMSPEDSADATVPLLTEIVPPGALRSEGHETSVRDTSIPEAGSWDQGTRTHDETWVVALEARIVEQVIERLQTSTQPLLDAGFDELLAQRLARLAGSLAAELRAALEVRLHDELGARVREAVHEAVWDAIDREGPPQRHL
jgi:hypothetical protein